MSTPESIASSEFPLGFRVRRGTRRPGIVIGTAGHDIFKVEARHFPAHHQKEAVVTEGLNGSAWRMVSDEGVHIKGDDLAPFPLGFFNAGLQADLGNRLGALAHAQGIELQKLVLQCRTGYSMSGSFFRGDGVGYAEPANIDVAIQSNAPREHIAALVAAAVQASPALAAMRTPVENTFALYVNGRRQALATLPDADGIDADDPLKTYRNVPAPLADDHTERNLIVKTGQKRAGTPTLTAPAATPTQRIVREVAGTCNVAADGLTRTDVALQLPGMSHFALTTDESEADRAPCGLSLLSAGIAFCYMTQLSRYIDYMQYKIRNVRLVQFNPYAFDGSTGGVQPVVTHLFLHGEEPAETQEHFMRVSAVTCFLHATLRSALEPRVTVTLNGARL